MPNPTIDQLAFSSGRVNPFEIADAWKHRSGCKQHHRSGLLIMQNLHALASFPAGLSYLLGTERTWGSPLFFTIETINACNFRCVYCPQSNELAHLAAGRGVMDLKDFRRIIANLQSAFDIRSVSLQRDGEPLLNPRIHEYVAHLTQHGIAAGFSSNCSRLNDEVIGHLLDAGLRRIKTDFCADPERYELLRVRGRWQETLDGVRRLLAIAEKKSLPLTIGITDLGTHGASRAESRRSIAEVRNLFSPWQNRVVVIPVCFHNALGQSLINLGGYQQESRKSRYCRCHQPWVNMTVDFAGRVVCCGRDLRSELVLGNLLEQSASEIWNGDPIRKLRRALIDRHPETIGTCRACDVPWSGSYSGRYPWEKVVSFFFKPFFKM